LNGQNPFKLRQERKKSLYFFSTPDLPPEQAPPREPAQNPLDTLPPNSYPIFYEPG